MIEKAPIVFTPVLKTVIWGGRRICSLKGLRQTVDRVGESWEISQIPGSVSVVATGTYEGLSLTELIERFGVELLGTDVVSHYGMEFPLLIKLIDAADNLSVQVHPGDSLARERHNCPGKDEMWYVVQADPGARIFVGFNRPVTVEEYESRVADGTFAETVAAYESRPGDVYFLPAGTVHSVGAGNLIAEIQQSSGITYRIYDYLRRDADGRLRELHTDQAKAAIDFSVRESYRPSIKDDGGSEVQLVSSRYFVNTLLRVDGTLKQSYDGTTFTVLMCVEGEVVLRYEGGEMKLAAGHTVLIPAAMHSLAIEGKGKLISAHCQKL